jgi:hypothetical protein
MRFLDTIDRLIHIHNLIQRRSTGPPDEFAAKLHLKRRQLYNVLEQFRDCGAIIKYSRISSSFYYVNNFEIHIEIKADSIDVRKE